MLSEYDWKSTNFPKILWILTGIPGKSFKFLRNSGIPQDFESADSGILQKLQWCFLDILKFLGTQFCFLHGGGGYFQEQPIIRHFKAGFVQFTIGYDVKR